MKNIFTFLLLVFIGGQFLWGQPANLVWNTQSRNASESMPCGGGDIGMNVWVENDDVLFYLSRSGSFDENNCLLKQGRFRVRLTPNPFAGTASFRQTLHLNDGYVSVSSDNATLIIWVDVFHPVVHVEVKTKELTSMRVNFESWRYEDRPVRKGEGQQCSYKWVIPDGLMTKRDSVCVEEDNFTFFHRNPDRTIFDVVVDQQGMNEVKEQLYNPLKNLIFGGRLSGDNLVYTGTRRGHYAGTEYLAWMYKSKKPVYKQSVHIALNTEQGTVPAWEASLARTEKEINVSKDKQATRRWWNDFWKRSFIEGEGEAGDAIRNYTLFRYMLGCNAYSQWPTKFNGGLFTFDPMYVDQIMEFTPDFRNGEEEP